MQNQTWPQFYERRVNNTESLAKFSVKYFRFLQMVARGNPGHIVEAGCGIASCAKLLATNFHLSSHFTLMDNSLTMLRLAQENLWPLHLEPEFSFRFLAADIRDSCPVADVVFSQGVLEHFPDEEIRAIVSLQKSVAKRVLHCVPSAKYQGGSFGDERLMTRAEWRALVDPDEIFEHNDGHELVLSWAGKRSYV